ncbi:Ion-translocating oxidoreductase complex subunit B [Methanosarcinaceae archaeon Ag5]|uniref:Ion-translocating oxidoreductase complex subunit B n=1 Tax=Methanolapillus africanus TaxID=3028297 RepID=A0AAE4SCD8_9EURY|nr:Ion-translocating oxidoreductase complex subunit B [Methanosarcinaceae archaeon Ag5]
MELNVVGKPPSKKVVRSIIKIDEEKCNGCGKCVSPCAEGAIQIINGKAKVVSEDLCDGMGFCIGVCPTGALTVETRETVPFDEEKAKTQPKIKDSSIVCYKCGKSEYNAYLLPMRHGGESLWVCTRCLPALIHG